jgi:hypothetical protein
MTDWATERVIDIISDEMHALVPIFCFPEEEFSEEALLSINCDEVCSQVQESAPILWRLLRHTAYTPRQDQRNKIKNPDMVKENTLLCIETVELCLQAVLTVVSVASFSCSHHSCKLPKLFTIYFKSCGLATKAFDTLHALGITMSQKWAYSVIEGLSEKVQSSLLKDIKNYPWFGTHDNVNIPFHVYEQWIDNQSRFDSGTAATIFVIKDPDTAFLDSQSFQLQRALGAKNPIALKDIFSLEKAAAPHIATCATHHILSFLTSSPAFSFKTYPYNDDPIFAPPPHVFQLPIGPNHITCHKTVHIEEASYDGNDRVLKEWWSQLHLGSLEDQRHIGKERIIIWASNQLTTSCLRGLQHFHCMDMNPHDRLEFLKEVFGWFHAQIAHEHSPHSQYYGTQRGFGLIQAFDLLDRKGLHAPSTQGNFHHHLKEGLYHIAEACFLDLWCIVGKVKNLEQLRERSPGELHALAACILQNYASSAALQHISAMNMTNDDPLYQSV